MNEIFLQLDDENKPPLIKPQKYEFVYVYHETIKLFSGRALKVVYWFRVYSMGEYNGIVLPRYYNIQKIIGKPGKNGLFVAGWKSDFLREYARLFGMPLRKDRLPLGCYTKHIFEGTVRTVIKGANQKLIDKGLQYSVIRELTGVKKI